MSFVTFCQMLYRIVWGVIGLAALNGVRAEAADPIPSLLFMAITSLLTAAMVIPWSPNGWK